MSRLPDGDEGAEAALDAWVEMVAHNQRHPDGVALYTAMSAAVIDASHQAHPWFRQHLMATIEYLVGALERGKAAGEVLPRADGGHAVDMRAVTAGVVSDIKDRWLVRS